MKNRRRFLVSRLFKLLRKRLILKLREDKEMICRNIQKKLSAFQDGELPSSEADRIKSHLLNCPDCKDEYNRLQRIWNVLGELPDIQATPGFYLKLHKNISGADKKRFFPRLRPAFQILPSPLAMVTLLFVGLVMGAYLGTVLFEEGLPSLQGRRPDYTQAHVSLASIRTFDTVPPGTLAHGYLKMASYQKETH